MKFVQLTIWCMIYEISWLLFPIMTYNASAKHHSSSVECKFVNKQVIEEGKFTLRCLCATIQCKFHAKTVGFSLACFCFLLGCSEIWRCMLYALQFELVHLLNNETTGERGECLLPKCKCAQLWRLAAKHFVDTRIEQFSTNTPHKLIVARWRRWRCKMCGVCECDGWRNDARHG